MSCHYSRRSVLAGSTVVARSAGIRLAARPTRYHDALQDLLLDRHGVQVPVWSATDDPRRVIRISAQLYNSIEQYEYLAGALTDEIERERQS